MTKAEMYNHLLDLGPMAASVRGRDNEAAVCGSVIFETFAVDVRDLKAKEIKDRQRYEAKMERSHWDEELGWVDPKAR